jgi:uncharacterized protein (TIGR03435 family)
MKASVLIVLGLAVVAIPIFSQAPGRPQFEVASIKVHPPPVTQIGITNRGGRFVATGFSLKMLVGRGYAVPELRIVGGPSWAESERYDIEAKAPDGAPANQLQPMLQAMLEDRFKLKVHKETRELPVYELVVGKNGLKMKLSDDQTPPAPTILPPADPGAGPRGAGVVARGGVPGPGGGPGGTFFGGGPRVRGTSGRGSINGRMTFEGSAVMVSVLVNTLQQLLDRPLTDKTGLTGLFDIKLEWIPGAEAPPGPFSPNPDAPPSPPVDGPSIFTAIQEQLGLRLEGSRGPVEVVAIDSAQKPAEN